MYVEDMIVGIEKAVVCEKLSVRVGGSDRAEANGGSSSIRSG